MLSAEISELPVLFHTHNLSGTCLCALAALDAIGMQVAFLLTTAVVWSELHGAHTGATLAFHLT